MGHKGGKSVFKIIIDSWTFTLRHTVLFLIELDNHAAPGSLLGLLILSLLDESGEAQRDAFATRIAEGVAPGLIPRTKSQIGRFDLPHKARYEPDVWLVLGHRRVRVKWFGFVDDVLDQFGVKFFQDGFREAGADVADCFVHLFGGVVAGQEECAVDGGTFSFAEVGT